MQKLRDCDQPQDIDAWIDEVDGIKPLAQPDEKPSAPLIFNPVDRNLDNEGLYNSNSFTPLAIGNTDNLDGRTANKFRKGLFKIEARLDLHGRTEKEAFAAVEDFIRNCYAKGRRCVLIITGKGQKKDDAPWYEAKGIIREALPSWLNHPEIRPFILSMTPAQVADGGSGAMYVLLKRRRALPQTEQF